ncbi:calcium-binding protein [Nonomuraea sp. NPDC052129]|uniref:calcium-binding protein n=1 Tax=Nonomuraea sp. NPDC052129 TaxID=3154651 RepID=UPI003429843C
MTRTRIRDRTYRVPRRMMRLLGGAAALAILPAVVAVQPAMAARPCYGDCQPGVVRGSGDLRYDAPVGVDDQITVRVDNGSFVLTDPTATLIAGTGCTLVTPHEAHCQVGASPSIRIRGLDGNDVITNSTGIPAHLFGETGNDQLVGGSGDDTMDGGFGGDVLQGGGGSDTVSYGETGGRLAIRADLDGATGDDGGPEDGPEGARDTIAADVENLEGGTADDVLIGNAGPNVIDGGGGRDQIQGLGGADQLTGKNGGGTLDGGAGTDHCISDIRLVSGPPDTFVNCEFTQIITAF